MIDLAILAIVVFAFGLVSRRLEGPFSRRQSYSSRQVSYSGLRYLVSSNSGSTLTPFSW